MREDATTVQVPRFFYYIHEGYGYLASKRFEGVANDTSFDIYAENPNGSGREVYIVVAEVTGLGNAYIDIYAGVTVTTPGTSLTIMKMRIDGEDPVGILKHGGSYDITGASKIHETVLPGGTIGRAIGAAVGFGEAVQMAEGDNFLVRVTNKSGGITDFSFRAVWWEEPE
jgi:hypothetical protein